MSSTLFDKELEQSFIGMCMVNSQIIREFPLSVSDFGTVDHRLIYESIVNVHEDHGKVDALLVAKQLQSIGELNRVGGSEYIYELQSVIVETDNAAMYATEILKLSARRKIYSLVHKAAKQAEDLSVDAEKVVAELQLQLNDVYFEQRKLESYTAKELANIEIPPVKWFIPNLLSSGLTILAGPPKIGKSYFCWNIALAVAQGGMVFSEIELEKKHNVTYLSLEDSSGLLKGRLEQLSDYSASNLHIIHDMQLKKFDAVGLKMLQQHIETTASDLVIVDTWAHVCPQVDIKGTAYDIDYNTLIPVQKFAEQHNIGIILVTHTRKAVDIDNAFNRIQGSTGMQAGCDTLMMLSHDSGSKTLHVTGRRIPAEQYAFTVDESGLWCLEGNAQDYRQGELRKEITQLLLESGDEGLATGDIIDLTGKPNPTIRSTLRRMVKDGQIEQPKIRSNYYAKKDDDDTSL